MRGLLWARDSSKKHGLLHMAGAVAAVLRWLFVWNKVVRALVGVVVKPLLIHVYHVHGAKRAACSIVARRWLAVNKRQRVRDAPQLVLLGESGLDLRRAAQHEVLCDETLIALAVGRIF